MTASARLPLLPADPDFERRLHSHALAPLRRGVTRTLQVNVGKLCNMACQHCHVEAGPKRTEVMTPSVVDRVLELVGKNPGIELVDITGGAPELNPSFRRLVSEVRSMGRKVIDRCNLSVLFEPGQEDLGEFLAAAKVHIIASLPCYQQSNVDKQRGTGAFDKSISGLQSLNALGFGRPGSALKLDLVYNPTGPSLPPPQERLEAEYKARLAEQFGIVFHGLLTLTNMPISRFDHELRRSGARTAYMRLLAENFNPNTVGPLMCRSLVSVAYDGQLYDCDFNQMLEINLGGRHKTVWEIDSFDELLGARVATASHCFGCTAGSGSSCSGALAT